MTRHHQAPGRRGPRHLRTVPAIRRRRVTAWDVKAVAPTRLAAHKNDSDCAIEGPDLSKGRRAFLAAGPREDPGTTSHEDAGQRRVKVRGRIAKSRLKRPSAFRRRVARPRLTERDRILKNLVEARRRIDRHGLYSFAPRRRRRERSGARLHAEELCPETELVDCRNKLVGRDLGVIELNSRLRLLETDLRLVDPRQPFQGCTDGDRSGATDHALHFDHCHLRRGFGG